MYNSINFITTEAISILNRGLNDEKKNKVLNRANLYYLVDQIYNQILTYNIIFLYQNCREKNPTRLKPNSPEILLLCLPCHWIYALDSCQPLLIPLLSYETDWELTERSMVYHIYQSIFFFYLTSRYAEKVG